MEVVIVGKRFTIKLLSENHTILTCPGCGVRANIDKDQFNGVAPVKCFNCGWHETHNFKHAIDIMQAVPKDKFGK